MSCSPSAEAGKKRRSASLDELRQRNATQRWAELQKTWQPIDQESAEQTATSGRTESADVVDETPSDRPALSATPARANAGQEDRQSSPVSAPFAFPATDVGADADAVEMPTQPGLIGTLTEQPVWMFGPNSVSDPQAMKRSEDSTHVALNAAQEEDRMGLEGINDARPKPITSILPYYDYSPNGDSPCEFLCPTPEGCPPDQLAKPCPELVQLPDVRFENRAFADMHVGWEPSNLFSNPLYFEDASLERYGHTHCDLLQPFVSLGKFSVQLVGLPYQVALHPVHERRYALGWYRPGECAPYKYYLPPWNAKAALTAGAVYTGLFYVIP